MNFDNPLIINVEVFFQCAGNCSGCFLSADERASNSFYLPNTINTLLNIIDSHPNKSHYIIGFGRGNLLNLPYSSIDQLASLMSTINEKLMSANVTFEVSTSLIGKIDEQIKKAKYLYNKIPNVFYNIVINSEITSSNFWNNWSRFYNELKSTREENGLSDYTGDILVLNVNPSNLPNLNYIHQYIKDLKSPINISIFPFGSESVSTKNFMAVNSWSKNMFAMLKGNDLNIYNFLNTLKTFNPEGLSFDDIWDYVYKNSSSYLFITRDGEIVEGGLSIMGELDLPRFNTKFGFNISKKKIIKAISSNKTCTSCEFLNHCIMSNAITNMVVNSEVVNNDSDNVCKSGYLPIFQDFFKSSIMDKSK